LNFKKSKYLIKKSLIASLVIGACSASAADDRYIIKFKAGLDGDNTPFSLMSQNQRELRAQNNRLQIQDVGGVVKRSLVNRNTVAATLSRKQLARLQAKGVIETFEEDPRRSILEPVDVSSIVPLVESTPYGITMVQALDVSDANSGSRKVCITDTGYTPNHEDLRASTGSNISGDDNNGAGSDTGDWFEDGHGHGTHVAGTISAHGNNGIGVIGVNRSDQIGLHIVKVFNNSGLWGYGSDLVAAIDQCVAAGANVISMSLGGGAPSTAEENAFIDAHNAGVLSIAAAGNDGTASGGDPLSYPASYDIVMSVAAVDSNKNVASWSQKNSQVEIAAPGVLVNSTLPGNTYAEWSGTSMATPHVSGVAALVWSHFNDCSPDDIRDAMNSTAEDRGSAGKDESYGNGIVNAKDAYDQINGAGGCGGGGNIAPIASFTDSCTALDCDFDGSASSDSDGTIDSYSWEFGDGDVDSGANVSHTYTANGTYTVSLTVEDNEGLTDTISQDVTVPFVDLETFGNTIIFGSTSTASNRRAMPYTMPEDGIIKSISMYHQAGGDDVLLGVYNGEGTPSSLLAVTPSTAVSGTTGWQTISLTSDVTVAGGDTVWLAWVYESNPGIRYEVGTPGRYDAGVGWASGMPASYGSGSQSNFIYSVYANYEPTVVVPPNCDVDEGFESGDGGWTNDAASSCSTGSFVVGSPTEVSNGGVITQLAGANSGSNAFFSAVNSSAGVNDVDGGECIVNSPVYSVTQASDISVAYYHGQRDAGDDAGDFFDLEISVNGGSYTSMASFGDVTSNAVWSEANTTASAGDQVQFRVRVADGAATGDLVEAGIDDVSICAQ